MGLAGGAVGWGTFSPTKVNDLEWADGDREVIGKPRAGLGVTGRVGGSRNGGFPELVGNMGYWGQESRGP